MIKRVLNYDLHLIWGGTIEYITGLYYQEADLEAYGRFTANAGAANNILDTACALGDLSTAATQRDCLFGDLADNMADIGRLHILDQETETWAIFGQATWNVNESLRATFGLRYTEERKSANQSVTAVTYEQESTTPIETSFYDGNPFGSHDPATLALGALLEANAHDFELARDEESLTWSINVQYDIYSDTMVYAAASTGFKAGGFNSFAMAQAVPGDTEAEALARGKDEAEYEEEEVLSFEIGAKMTLAEGAAELNIAYFYTEYDDLQTALFTGNTSFVVQNAAKAETQGIEIDGRWQLTENLMLQGSLGWVDFEFVDFPTAGCHVDQLLQFREDQLAAGNPLAAVLSMQDCSSAGINDLSGRPSENTPEFTASLIANYIQTFGDFELNTSVDINYMDEAYRQADLDPELLDNASTKINANLTIGSQEGNWDVSLIARNLTDETTISYGNDAPLFDGARQVMLDAPRSVSIRGRMRF